MKLLARLGPLAALLTVWMASQPLTPAHAECAASWFLPSLVTDTTRPVPSDVTLLVIAESDFRHEAYRAGAFVNGFALTRRGRRVPLVVEELGLGIARLRPSGTLTNGLWRLEGLPTAASVNVAEGATLPPVPSAPEGVSVSMPRMRGQAATSDLARAVMAFFEPETVRSALLLGYWGGELSAVSRVRPNDARVTLYRPLRCTSRPGVRAPASGEERELAWMDGYGRESARYRVP
ncbi:MAG: hypothetical protein H6726_23610 [Sandaracinaceae bacterium]|nr:hypothetical protein [Sandaracinaceae bacterium]